MQLFVSYSRRDGDVAARLISEVEALGHSAWRDTSEIHGGAQWREAIVGAIARADAVLLLISPAAITSENVAREVNLADEHETPIIPVVLERCDVTKSRLAYAVSGLQYIVVDHRPLHEVACEVDIAATHLDTPQRVGAAGNADRREPATAVPITPVRTLGLQKKLAAILAVAAAVAAAGLIASRSSGQAGPLDRSTSTGLSAADGTLSDGNREQTTAGVGGTPIAIGKVAYYAGFEVTVESVSVLRSPGGNKVDITFLAKNLTEKALATFWSDVALTIADTSAPVAVDLVTVPSGGANRTHGFATVDHFDANSATLTIGAVDELQSTVPLGDGPVDTFVPRTVPVAKSATSPGGLSVEVVEAHLQPFGANVEGVAVAHSARGEIFVILSIRGRLDRNSTYPNVGLAQLALRSPDAVTSSGAEVDARSITAGVEFETNVAFSAAIPLRGTYAFTFAAFPPSTPQPATISFDLG